MDGILLINKPAGYTSHDIVGIVRKKLHTKKVGHCGTLDPDATGVLVVCVNKATKAIQFKLFPDADSKVKLEQNKYVGITSKSQLEKYNDLSVKWEEKLKSLKNITVTEEEEKDLQDNIDSDLEAMNNENSGVDNSTTETDKIAETEAKEAQVEEKNFDQVVL